MCVCLLEVRGEGVTCVRACAFRNRGESSVFKMNGCLAASEYPSEASSSAVSGVRPRPGDSGAREAE